MATVKRRPGQGGDVLVSTVQAASGSPSGSGCQWWHLAVWAARARRLGLGVPLAATGSLSLSGGGAHWQLPPVSPKVKAEPTGVYRR